MPTFKLTAKKDFGSGNKKVKKGLSVVMVSGSNPPAFQTSQITEAVNSQLGINCIPASMCYFNYTKI